LALYEKAESERDLDSRPWCLLVSSRLLSFVPSALRVRCVLPSSDQVIIEVTPRPGDGGVSDRPAAWRPARSTVSIGEFLLICHGKGDQ
jgi:hypothetical protein